MISLSQAKEGIPYFVLSIECSREEKKFLHGIGIAPESLLTVKKNNVESGDPVVVEVCESQFMIGRDLAEQIIISPALFHQEVIFQGNKTKQRETILGVIQVFTGHFSLRECVKMVQEKDKKIGEITVYRTLKTLTEKGLLEEVELPDGTKKLELLKGHHDHIVCKNCGNIIEFFNAEIEALQKKVAKENNITMLSHTMTLVASDCDKCRD